MPVRNLQWDDLLSTGNFDDLGWTDTDLGAPSATVPDPGDQCTIAQPANAGTVLGDVVAATASPAIGGSAVFAAGVGTLGSPVAFGPGSLVGVTASSSSSIWYITNSPPNADPGCILAVDSTSFGIAIANPVIDRGGNTFGFDQTWLFIGGSVASTISTGNAQDSNHSYITAIGTSFQNGASQTSEIRGSGGCTYGAGLTVQITDNAGNFGAFTYTGATINLISPVTLDYNNINTGPTFTGNVTMNIDPGTVPPYVLPHATFTGTLTSPSLTGCYVAAWIVTSSASDITVDANSLNSMTTAISITPAQLQSINIANATINPLIRYVLPTRSAVSTSVTAYGASPYTSGTASGSITPVDKKYVLTGHDNYVGGDAGTLTLPAAGNVLTGSGTYGVVGALTTPSYSPDFPDTNHVLGPDTVNGVTGTLAIIFAGITNVLTTISVGSINGTSQGTGNVTEAPTDKVLSAAAGSWGGTYGAAGTAHTGTASGGGSSSSVSGNNGKFRKAAA